MEITDMLKYYVKLKEIMTIVEKGDWRNHKITANLTIEQVEKVKESITIFEEWNVGFASIPHRVD